MEQKCLKKICTVKFIHERERAMRKVLTLILTCSFMFFQSLSTFGDSSLDKNRANLFPSDDALKVKSVVIVSPNNGESKESKKSNDLVQSKPKYDEEFYKPSKWEITKNIAKYLGKAFVDDVKSYILFYPLFKVAQLISFFAIYLPSYGFYKKTGIDIPAKVSSVFTKSESMNIIGQNLYNLIPLTLASFMFKWGRDLYSFAKS